MPSVTSPLFSTALLIVLEPVISMSAATTLPLETLVNASIVPPLIMAPLSVSVSPPST